jgi:hypothetical protein
VLAARVPVGVGRALDLLALHAVQVARGEVALGDLLQRGVDGGARVEHLGAAGPEVAAARRIERARDVALEDDPLPLPLAAGVGDRHRRQQRLRVRVLRLARQPLGVGDLDDPTQVHDGDAVADVLDGRQVVGDEQVGQVELVLQPLHQVEHLRLDRDVERGDRFVGDDEVGLARQGAGDADALALTAGELVRVPVAVVGVQPDGLEQLPDALGPCLPALVQAVDLQRLRHGVADGAPWVQRGHRVLEDHRHAPAQRAQLLAPQVRDVLPVEDHATAGRVDQA